MKRRPRQLLGTAARVLALLIAGPGLTACGFQLQGSASYDEDLAAVYLQVPDASTPLARALRRSMEAARVPLADAGDALTRVELVRENTGRRVASVSAQNRPTELEVFYTARYRILGPETELLGEQRVTRSRIFTYDELDILGKTQEEDMLREALAREIAGVITRRLAGLAE
jgi:LPS-assembly lipoprotein